MVYLRRGKEHKISLAQKSVKIEKQSCLCLCVFVCVNQSESDLFKGFLHLIALFKAQKHLNPCEMCPNN